MTAQYFDLGDIEIIIREPRFKVDSQVHLTFVKGVLAIHVSIDKYEALDFFKHPMPEKTLDFIGGVLVWKSRWIDEDIFYDMVEDTSTTRKKEVKWHIIVIKGENVIRGTIKEKDLKKFVSAIGGENNEH